MKEPIRPLSTVAAVCMVWALQVPAWGCDTCDDQCPPDPAFVQTDKRDLAGLAKVRAARRAALMLDARHGK